MNKKVKMNLVVCGILTALAILLCVIYDETLMFNMMMCVFCVLAIISLWTKNTECTKDENNENSENVEKTSSSEKIK